MLQFPHGRLRARMPAARCENERPGRTGRCGMHPYLRKTHVIGLDSRASATCALRKAAAKVLSRIWRRVQLFSANALSGAPV
eukprot:2619035-Prymnesium_polylepis.1